MSASLPSDRLPVLIALGPCACDTCTLDRLDVVRGETRAAPRDDLAHERADRDTLVHDGGAATL